MSAIILLDRPQLPQNIGMVARAMLNFGLQDLRLIAPREGWPQPESQRPAAGAEIVLDQAKVYPRLEDAILDLPTVFAITARPRFMQKPTLPLAELPARCQGPAPVGLLFGSESSGLDNEAIVLCDAVIHIPVNPGFSSLNLAQAVFAVASELWRAKKEGIEAFCLETPAPRGELLAFYEQLESTLDERGFFFPLHKRENMVHNLRNLFQKASLTSQEIRTLRGIIKWISQKDPKMNS